MLGLDYLSAKATVPRDLRSVLAVRPDTEVPPERVGLEPAAIESVARAFESYYATGIHPAMQICLRHRGHVILDRAIGHASGNGPGDRTDEPKILATPDTLFNAFSASKAVTAMLIHRLDQEGLLHLSDRVCEYVPEFAKHGKSGITIHHILSHRAGIPLVPPEMMDLDHLFDRSKLLEVMVEAKPVHRPGSGLAYHAITGGFILAEIVERITGKDIRRALEDEILAPLGMKWTRYGVKPNDVDLVARNYYTGPPQLPIVSYALRRALSVSMPDLVRMSNDDRFLTSIIPSGNVVTTASELSRFYQLLLDGGEMDGVRVFEPRTIRRAISEQSYLEFDGTIGLPIRYSLGFMLGARWVSLYGPDTEHAFGHLGFTNIVAWADPARQLAGAILTSGKPLVYPEIYYAFDLLRQIGLAFPKQ